ncbi:adenylate/guanylate cyclase domain-containing protein [Robertkochia flava]|uniref:adenylate/guanylate cyclase domain-containing protein n=1 Tax=Robertkochia flava TaxID=3447986 RepID=UPI001CCE5B26|nr:adenylate/guanylate cyclase domain-containing protein [Robertkochia marina]
MTGNPAKLHFQGIPYWLILQCLMFFPFVVFGQQTPAAALELYSNDSLSIDSLIRFYHSERLNDEEKLKFLNEITFNNTIAYPTRIAYGDTMLVLAKKQKDSISLISAHLNRAHAFEDMGSLSESIRENLEAIKVADRIRYKGIANAYNSLGYVYTQSGNFPLAEKYLKQAIALQMEVDSTHRLYLASMYYNLGDTYLQNDQLDSAYVYLQKSKGAFAAINVDDYDPYIDGNTGVYFLKSGQVDKAEPLILHAARELESQYPEGAMEYYNHLTDLALLQEAYDKANTYAGKALEIGENTGTINELIATYFNLYEIYEAQNKPKQALEYFIRYKQYQDSAVNLPTIQKMANLRNEFEVANKQKEVDLLVKEAEIQQLRASRQRTISLVSVTFVVLLSLLIFGLFNRFKYIRKTSRVIEDEKNRSDALLRNILPDETANELKEHGRVKAKKFSSVSVMFADFEGFTRYSEDMDPEELVKRVDFYFSAFDAIMEKYNLEKIKTMGDAYMCAGGLPFPEDDHAIRMVMAAYEMAAFVDQVKKEDPDDPTRFEVRIGINTGPVVAGVVGTKKFVYDIWGDTVNIASRMESNSEPGRINVSENTYQRIKDRFDCTFRGMVEVKNKGMMKMYYVNPLTQEHHKVFKGEKSTTNKIP